MDRWEEQGDRVLRQRGIRPESMQLLRVSESPAGAHLDYQQVHAGLPVFDAGAKLHFNRRTDLLLADVSLVTHLLPPEPVRLTVPDAATAQRIAAARMGGRGLLRGHPVNELGIAAMGDGRCTVAWRVLCPTYVPFGDWLLSIDAVTGAVLSAENTLARAPRTRVFCPNPIVTSGNPWLYDLARLGLFEPLHRELHAAELHGLVNSDNGHAVLAGELVRIVNANPPFNRRLTGRGLVFHPGTPEFAAVMAYFWLDTALRYLKGLGFRDLLPRGVEADPLDWTARGGSYYSRWSRRLGFAPPEPGQPAVAEDAKVILHELGHAIQHDQVRNWGGNPEAKAMGEGFGDAFATIFFAHVNGGFRRNVVGDWAEPPGGIRRVDRNLRYPMDMNGVPHHDGQIWARALWDLYLMLGGNSPAGSVRLRARDTALRLIVQSHYFLRRGARFADGARALLLADQELHQRGCALAILTAMRDRGIFPYP